RQVQHCLFITDTIPYSKNKAARQQHKKCERATAKAHAQRIHKEKVGPGGKVYGITPNAELNKGKYRDAGKKRDQPTFYGYFFISAEIIHHSHSGDSEQI